MNASPGAEGVVPVNILNFVRAESDTYFAAGAARSGINTWHHTRQPTPIDEQLVVRMNRDTLYSSACVDISQGATLTLPDAGGRYQTVMVVNQDHYINRVFDRPGSYALTVEEFDTPFVFVAARILVDPENPDDVRAVNTLQDQLRLEAGSARPFTHPRYDQASLNELRSRIQALGYGLNGMAGAFGPKTQVNPILHLIGTARGWGGLPEDQAFYMGVEPRRPVGHYTLTVGEVPVRAFWSLSVYNRDGFFERNPLGRYSINSITATPNSDGTVTVHFGGDPSLPNQVPIMEGWNYTVRLYQPEPAILSGTWSFPELRDA